MLPGAGERDKCLRKSARNAQRLAAQIVEVKRRSFGMSNALERRSACAGISRSR